MKIQKFEQITNWERLSKIVFLNFVELENEHDIIFNINDIQTSLKSSGLLGWFLLDNDNKIIGYIIGELKDLVDGRYVYYISYFFIISKYRSKGLGFKMMLNCINYINEINVKYIVLISNVTSSAYKLYKKLGFTNDPIIKINNPNYTVLTYYINE